MSETTKFIAHYQAPPNEDITRIIEKAGIPMAGTTEIRSKPLSKRSARNGPNATLRLPTQKSCRPLWKKNERVSQALWQPRPDSTRS